jgi:DNA-binding NtrC family response regulator
MGNCGDVAPVATFYAAMRVLRHSAYKGSATACTTENTMLNAMCQTSRTILHRLSPLSPDDEPVFDDSRASTNNVLIIDEHTCRMSERLRTALILPEYQVQVAISAPGDALRPIRADAYDVVILCVGGGTPSEFESYHQIRRIDPSVPVIFVACAARADVAIEAIKLGAYDFLFQPVEPAILRGVVSGALDVARDREQPSAEAISTDVDLQLDSFVGRCPAMGEVYKAIGRVADQNVIVLINGESGTGKELAARAIYQHSSRSDKPFLAINCAAIPENLLESELFGHEKGAFTGADRRRIGKFEQCNGGTIFLDEIGDMPLATQGKILRLLQDQKFERVGGNQTIQTDVRVIAATNRDLKAFSEQGKFRPDLYYRLSVFTIRLPALRERGDDLPVLTNYYLRRFTRELGREVREVAPETMQRLRAYSWPGNIRELQSVVKQALLHATGTVLIPAFLPELSNAENATEIAPGAASNEGWSAFADFIRQRLRAGITGLNAEAQLEVDRVLLPAVLEFTDANQLQAAKILGLSRQTLRQRLRNIGRSVVKSFDDPSESPTGGRRQISVQTEEI